MATEDRQKPQQRFRFMCGPDEVNNANCWGIANNLKGANTNRIVVFQKTRLKQTEFQLER